MDDSDRVARKLSALLDLGLTPVEVPPVASETVKVGGRRYKVLTARPSMGTLVSMAVIHSSRDRAEEAVGRAFEEIDRLVGILSRHDESTALAYLNREGFLEGMPPEMGRVVARALYYNRVSNGTFDISVKPVVDLLERKAETREGIEPTEDEMREALALTGSGGIELTEHTIGFKKQRMGITLDGIAKGYIVDRVAEVLAGHRIKNFLINAGGDIRTAGRRDDRKPWTVAVQDPAKGGEYPDIIHLSNRAVATSGGYEIYFDPEMKLHHIVDSATGRSPGMNASVSVVAPTAIAADALATTLFLMEPAGWIALMESLPGCECLIVDAKGAQSKTKGWESAPR